MSDKPFRPTLTLDKSRYLTVHDFDRDRKSLSRPFQIDPEHVRMIIPHKEYTTLSVDGHWVHVHEVVVLR